MVRTAWTARLPDLAPGVDEVHLWHTRVIKSVIVQAKKAGKEAACSRRGSVTVPPIFAGRLTAFVTWREASCFPAPDACALSLYVRGCD